MEYGKREPEWLWWGIHNCIGHPVMQICVWLGLKELGYLIHDETLPRHAHD